MTEDRYAVNKPLYLIGMICLIFAMGLVMFALFIMPRLLWNLHYDVPTFVMEYQVWLQDDWDWSERASDWMVLGSFFIPGILLGLISDWASNRIDAQMHQLPAESHLLIPSKRSPTDWWFLGKVTMTIILVLVAFLLINTMID